MTSFDTVARAARHAISLDRPAVRFTDGALLGNGGMGVVVRTRPDAVLLHFGHNDVWDIRTAEKNREKLGTFEELFRKVKTLPDPQSDPWLREFQMMARENYAKPYPRPMPCGTVLLGFPRRDVELLGHRLDVSTGVCEVRFLVRGETRFLRLFACQDRDEVAMAMCDERGAFVAAPFDRVRLLPDPEATKTMPSPVPFRENAGGLVGFRQTLPFQEPDELDAIGHPNDRAFRLAVRIGTPLRRERRQEWHRLVEMGDLEGAISSEMPFFARARLEHGPARELGDEGRPFPADAAVHEEALSASRRHWATFWDRSGIALDDEALEAAWYRNLYFLGCASKEGVACPGLWANWSYGKVGTAWHGDYHFNYNVQQPFWGTFSSNHAELHQPYVALIHRLLPLSRQWARDYYGLRGAFFPHSAYPVEMNVMPYPLPGLGWEVCETPWAVQSLWWHYAYTQDRAFLEERAFPPIRDAVLFLVDYMKRPAAAGSHWGDDRYHIFPTVAPELHGLSPGLDRNRDCLVTLTLTRFVFQAYLDACAILGREGDDASLMGEVREILGRFPRYPTAPTPQGEVWVSVAGEEPEVVVNTPNPLAPVFPGDECGLGSDPAALAQARRTLGNLAIEGGNELVFLNLQAARLGALDLEKFKRQLDYCRMPNGTFADMVLQTQGRYADTDEFDFMAPMGVWVENFAVTAVINECLLQSYDGVIRLFPNWPAGKAAEFRTLRAVGAFLVSAAFREGEVAWVEVRGEAGGMLRLRNPWQEAQVRVDGNVPMTDDSPIVSIRLAVGQTVRLEPKAARAS